MDLRHVKVGVVLAIEDCGNNKASKTLKACKVNIGDEANPITVVTSAPNVREGSRLAVALEGFTYVGDNGEEIPIKKTAVGGVLSEGMFCDSKMLGWAGGAEGVAAQIPDSIGIGAPPPTTKPRHGPIATTDIPPPSSAVQGLFEKKLTKEEKKKLAEEKRKARRAAKDASVDQHTEEKNED